MLRRMWQWLRGSHNPIGDVTSFRDEMDSSANDEEPFQALPHPANVPGPFYVKDGCCISCGVWEEVASDLLAWDGDGEYSHCYVKRQPTTDDEFERMKLAMEYGEVDCIRVHACKPEWEERLWESGLGHHIDPESGPLTR